MRDKKIRFRFRKKRTRDRLHRAANGLPRLSVYRSLKYFYAQVIDDAKGKTVASANSRAKEGKCAKNLDAAKAVGKLIAERTIKAGVEKVVFDRGGNVYHGRIKALADAAREAGLKF